MANKRTGQEVPCAGGCGKLVYKCAAYLKRNVRVTCGSWECRSAIRSGANNPFWGKNHTEETKARFTATRKANPLEKYGPEKGSFKQSPEAKAKMSAALRERWKNRRAFMLANLPRGEDHHMKGLYPEPRYRKNFTALQRREWTGTSCVWCEAVEDLVLDHIFPVMCGGKNVKTNCQTLCRPCNLWKMVYVDRPLMLSLSSQGGQT